MKRERECYTMPNVTVIFLILTLVCVNAQNCNKIFAEEQVIVESPGYPSNYPSNLRCSYIFKGPTCSTFYNFQFLDFNLSPSEGCVNDRLEIHEQDALCGTKTGMRTYHSSNGVLETRFVSDSSTSGRGFKILVTRSACNQTGSTSLPFCCSSSGYNSKRFFLSSPGFPQTNPNNDCTYHIRRANFNVCRLRIHFHFFWVSEPDCRDGFLELDGKFICGCRTGLKLTSEFDLRSSNPKILRYKSKARDAGGFLNGFVLEIVQDECPKRLEPNSTQVQQFNRISSLGNVAASGTVIERALLVKENTEILDDNDQSVKHVYFFESPDYDYDAGYDIRNVATRDVEETTYVDTTLIKSILPDGYDNFKCKSWGGLQWAALNKEILWQQMPGCRISRPTSRQCEDASYLKGYIQSPGYPNYYPGNTNLCYRLRTRPGFCGIRLIFVDFDVENNFQCRNSYLLLGGYRYCGRTLEQAVLTFDLSTKSHEDISFTTARQYCGRGFRGIYEQIPCNNPITPPNPVYPTKPPLPPLPTPPPSPPLPPNPSCNRDIREEFFILEGYGHNQPNRCVFTIQKAHPNVCRLALTFVEFNLPCGMEQLVINNRRYCGQISRQTLNVNFNQYLLLITYERLSGYPVGTGSKFRINARQLSGCDPYEFPNVPPQRFLTANLTNSKEPNDTGFSDKKLDDTCGLILNATEHEIANGICKSLLARNNNIECVPITAKIIYVPYNSTDDLYESVISQINTKNEIGSEELGVNEISCKDIDRISKK